MKRTGEVSVHGVAAENIEDRYILFILEIFPDLASIVASLILSFVDPLPSTKMRHLCVLASSCRLAPFGPMIFPTKLN